VDGDRILLCRIRAGYFYGDQGGWTLPGGGLDFGEAPHEASIRELAEETGLVGEVDYLADVLSWSNRYVDRATGLEVEHHAIQVIYRVTITSGELRNEPDGSTDIAAWVSRTDAAALPLVDLAQEGIRLAFGET
jgi:8-oxo-dGTP diphosphatase